MHDDVRCLFGREFAGVDDDVGVLGLFVDVADAGEVFEFAPFGFFIDPFVVTFFTSFEVGFDVDDDVVFDHLADRLARLSVGGDEGGHCGDAVVLEALDQIADTFHVTVAIFSCISDIGDQLAYIARIDPLDGYLERSEFFIDEIGDGRLARKRQSGKPEIEGFDLFTPPADFVPDPFVSPVEPDFQDRFDHSGSNSQVEPIKKDIDDSRRRGCGHDPPAEPLDNGTAVGVFIHGIPSESEFRVPGSGFGENLYSLFLFFGTRNSEH